jgi:ribonuclease J
MKPGKELLFCPLGGSGEIGMNLNLYGCNGKWVMVDLGMTFATPSLPGVDLVLPDPRFIEEHLKDLLGIVLTHGHEDHIGAIPYLAADLGVPMYATPFTAGLIRHKLREENLEREVKLHIIPMGGSVQLGPFGFKYVHLAHSIPEGNALVIDTPYGKIFHTGDWKLDEDPILGNPASPAELTAIGDEGILALVGDSTNVFEKEASGSEGGVRDGLMKVVQGRKTGRVLVTTFASNVARLDSIGQVAVATNRRLCVVGRSMDRIIGVAKDTGFLKNFPPLITLEEASFTPAQNLMIASTGCQGEERAALARIVSGQHRELKLTQGDLVIFSSKKIPGNEISIGIVQNQLAERGIDIVTERDAHVHVSGHPGQPELEAMYGWIRPAISVPVHGEMRHMRAHAELAKRCGVAHAIVPSNGAMIRLAPGKPALVSHVEAGRLVVDGDAIIPSDGQTMIERRRLLMNGYLGATLVVGKNGRLITPPHITLQGLPVEQDRDEFIERAANEAAKAYDSSAKKHDDSHLADRVRVAVRRVAKEFTGKKPVTDVSIIRV